VYTKGIIKKEREFKMNIKYKTPGVFKNHYMDRVKFFNKYKKEPFTALEELSDVGVDTLDTMHSDMKKVFKKYFVNLTPRELMVIKGKYFDDLTLNQIGRTLAGLPTCRKKYINPYGVTQERVRQIEDKALRKLRYAMKNDNAVKDLI
jgi:DNA-directed RNA polymerase sigma subunit (sigma70/sigma32)